MKKVFVLLSVPLLMCACSGSGLKEKDDNNILTYEKNSAYFFKGSLGFGIYDRPEAASIYDLQKEQSETIPDEVRNDCIVAASSTLASLVQGQDGTITIPLYQDFPKKNIPLDGLTKDKEGSIKGRTYTYLKKENNEFYWGLNGDERFFIYFVPAYQCNTGCFKTLNYKFNIKYSFSYYDSNQMLEKERHEEIKTITNDQLSKTCYNNSIMYENFDIPLCNKKISEVYAPTIHVYSIGGTINPVFNNPDEERNIINYIRSR